MSNEPHAVICAKGLGYGAVIAGSIIAVLSFTLLDVRTKPAFLWPAGIMGVICVVLTVGASVFVFLHASQRAENMSSQPEKNEGESIYVAAIESLDPAELAQYRNKVVAVGLNGEGVVASGETLDELTEAVTKNRGPDFRYIMVGGPFGG